MDEADVPPGVVDQPAETDLLARGLVPAGLLDGPKASVLLVLTLVRRTASCPPASPSRPSTHPGTAAAR